MLSLDAVGIGLRQPHYRRVLEERPDLGFLEVHSENFFMEGGAGLALLERVRATYLLSLHGVGLSLGSADGLASHHLEKLARLCERVDPTLVSEHLCWGAIDGAHLNDLLPLPYTGEALRVLAARVDAVQTRLKRRIAVENVSAYISYRDSTWTETAFLAELARRTGCGILLDLNNLYVNAVNFGGDVPARLGELDGSAIMEIHLAGHAVTDECLIDDHGSRVVPPVWDLYREALRRFGPRPTLIEWDTDVPPLETLLDEVALARRAHAPVHKTAHQSTPETLAQPTASHQETHHV